MGNSLRSMALGALVALMVFAGGSAWGAELDTLGQKIDQAGTPVEASRVTDRIVNQWSGTAFKFDAASAPRALTAQDVQNLRAQGLGYGEISILLGLTANQPSSTTAKSLDQILATRQSGTGWGQLARELGYKDLGSVVKSVRATEQAIRRSERIERAKGAKPEDQRAEERQERQLERADGQHEARERPEKAERLERTERPERVERMERPERVERMERIERPERPERRGR